MTPAEADAIRAWQARQDATRDEARRNPSTTGHVEGPCLAPDCTRPTRHHDGYCSHHRELRPRRDRR